MKKKTTFDFIKEAQDVHGDKYNYSKVEYVSNKGKVCIICPKHGEFWQTPYKHLKGQGCPQCAMNFKNSLDSFIDKAKAIHGDKYDYSKVIYINNNTKICIICPEHGEFWQTPHNHLKGQGCPLCGKFKTKSKKYTSNTFIQEARNIHGDKYDYTKANYINMLSKLCIICPKHGEFWQTPYTHLRFRNGCPICAHNQNGLNKRKTTEEFINDAKAIHGEKYDYSKVEYITAKNKVCIICPTHGEFWQSPWHHISGCGCPKCIHPTSKAENDILDYVKSIVDDDNIEQSNRKILGGKELDIYIPSKKVAIEYNGLYWHTTTVHPDKNYHLMKLNLCKGKGIRLIQIFEDEWENHREIVLSKIGHILGVQQTLPKIMGRKCEIKEIDKDLSKDFLNKNHIQGTGFGTVHLGAFYNEQLIAVMLFKKEKNDENKWELTRFASDNNYVCQGIGGKLFKYFLKNYNPEEIKSFADRRWTINEDSNIYIQLGFKFDSYTLPEYRYFRPEDGIERQHKFGFRKQILNKKYGLPLSMTEREMTEKLGYIKIYDAGLIKYIWKKEA